MNISRTLGAILGSAATVILLAGCGGETKRLQAENEALRAEIAELKTRAESEAQANTARSAELTRLQRDAQEAVRLRGEVTQLRTTTKDAEKLRADNQQLRNENQQLRGAAAAAPAPTAPTAPATPTPGSFPRESWTFAGYTSPEAALVSAIHSMQSGNPKQYFESLTTEEQLRMNKAWENKTAEEIAAKHVSDTAQITGFRVLTQQAISENEVQMNVFIEGVNRPERVSMKRIGNDWKFGGFIREPAKP
jgi:hypothetical protein